MRLFLVSLSRDSGRIGREGFYPCDQLPYMAHQAPRDVVILTTDEQSALADARERGTGVWEVELETLNTASLFPSHRFLTANGLANYHLEAPEDVATAASRMSDAKQRREYLTTWYSRNYERFKARWRRSLDWGEVAHRGEIPPRALRFIPLVQNPAVMFQGIASEVLTA